MADVDQIRKQASDFYIRLSLVNAAPWQLNLSEAGSVPTAPIDPISGHIYRGLNAMRLLSLRETDTRYSTATAVAEHGLQIIAGERPKAAVFLTQMREGMDYVHPVFHVSQLEGLANAKSYAPGWSSVELLDVLPGSEAVRHVTNDAWRYAFSPEGYVLDLPKEKPDTNLRAHYGRLLHQYIRAEVYAGENAQRMSPELELRAQMATLITASRLRLPFDGREVSAEHGKAWIELLSADSNKLFELSAAAERTASATIERGFSIEQSRNAMQPQQDRFNVDALRMAHPDRVYIFAIGDQYSQARAVGGTRYDAEKKLLYVPAGADLSRYAKWLEPPATYSHQDMRAAFRSACEGAGLVMADDKHDHPIVDGQWHNVKVTTSRNRSKRSGAYRVNDSGYGHISNKDTGESIPWHMAGIPDDSEQSRQMRDAAKANRERAAAEAAIATQRAEDGCAAQWAKLPDAIEHPYLTTKEVPAYGLKLWGSRLVVPLLDGIEGRVVNLQTIPPNGGLKLYQKDARKSGMFFVLGDPAESATLLFSTGYATAATLYQGTGNPVVVCFDDANMQKVGTRFREWFKEKDFIFCADNDDVTVARAARILNEGKARETFGYPLVSESDVACAVVDREHVLLGDHTFMLAGHISNKPEHFNQARINVEIFRIGDNHESVHRLSVFNSGVENAMAAAAATNGRYVVPKFSAPDFNAKGWSDFNDLAKAEGLSAVQKQIGAVVDRSKGRQDAERLATSHNLSFQFDVKADGGRYTGEVVGHAGSHAVQEVGRKVAVAHAHADMQNVPGKGDKVRVRYQDGKPLVEPTGRNSPNKGQER